MKKVSQARLIAMTCAAVLAAASLSIQAESGAAAATAVTATPPNGCGTGWSVYFVPDSIPLAGCDFSKACDEHDGCYGKCETSIEGECEYRKCRPGGSLSGSTRCLTDEKLLALASRANQRRLVCDNKLCDKIREVNKGKAICQAFAIIYREAVKTFGDTAFNGLSGEKVVNQSQDEYVGAVRAFLTVGTEKQFKDFVAAADAGKPKVDFSRPLAYDAPHGLKNVPEKNP
jgi:hypothetical protein